jgi:hypothetical protein
VISALAELATLFGNLGVSAQEQRSPFEVMTIT